MLKLTFFVTLMFGMQSIVAQRFLQHHALGKPPLYSIGIRFLRIDKLAAPSLAQKMLGTTSACNNINNFCATLPATLVEFDAHRNTPDKVSTNWETKDEINVNAYRIERSLDNLSSFIEVGTVAARQGYSNKKNYDFLDDNSFENISYYRLKIVDEDGKFKYSKIVAVKGFSTQEKFRIFLNPPADNLSLSIILNKGAQINLIVTDALGKDVLHKNTFMGKGSNSISLSIYHLVTGVYTVRLVRDNEPPMIAKFVKIAP